MIIALRDSTHADDLVVHLLQVTVYLRSIDGHAAEWLELVTGQNDRGIREAFSLGDEVDLLI
jgi:hypothetical protein